MGERPGALLLVIIVTGVFIFLLIMDVAAASVVVTVVNQFSKLFFLSRCSAPYSSPAGGGNHLSARKNDVSRDPNKEASVRLQENPLKETTFHDVFLLISKQCLVFLD